MYSDPSGHFLLELLAAFVMLCTPVGGAVFQAVVSTACYAGFAVASLFNKDIRKDMQDIGFNMFNTDEALVLQSQKVSFYKGKPVFKVPGNSGFSFGALFLSRNWGSNDIDLVKTVIPSVTGYIADKLNLLSPIQYYELPWEYDADKLGGAITKSRLNITYWDFLKMILKKIF